MFQPLARQPVLAKDANGLGHIANFINLGKLRRFNRVILRGQPLHDIAQTDDGIQHPPLKNKAQHKQEHQRREPNHDLRERTPDPRFLRRLGNGFIHPAFEHQAKVVKLRLDPLELLLIGGAVKQVDRLFFLAPGNLRQRRPLLVLEFIGHL